MAIHSSADTITDFASRTVDVVAQVTRFASIDLPHDNSEDNEHASTLPAGCVCDYQSILNRTHINRTMASHNPTAFFDIAIAGQPSGTIVMIISLSYTHNPNASTRTHGVRVVCRYCATHRYFSKLSTAVTLFIPAENFRALCTGEKVTTFL